MIQLQIFSFFIIFAITVFFKSIQPVTMQPKKKQPETTQPVHLMTQDADSNDLIISTIATDSDNLNIPAIKSDRFIVLSRHGETEWTRDGIFCGWYDSPLTDKGREDAVKCANKINTYINTTFDQAYTSQLGRANESLDIILKTIGQVNVPIKKSWKLNERHYGELTGQIKTEALDNYGEDKLNEYRRSYDVLPPAITKQNQFYDSIINNQNFIDDGALFPSSESLKTTMERVVPYWDENIAPDIQAKRKVLMVIHGTVLRSLIKHLEKISDTEINDINVPTGIPFIYEFDENMNIIGSRQYLAGKNELEDAIKRAKNIKHD